MIAIAWFSLTYFENRSLACNNVLPIGVVGFGRQSAVDRMKTQCMLAGDGDVHVFTLLPPEDPTTALSATLSRRIQIHFSEAVDDFIEDDLLLQNCTVSRFAQITGDLYTATLQIGKSDHYAYVQVPAGVARSHRSAARLNLASNTLQLR